MFGLDPAALFVGFAAGVVLWGGLSFAIDRMRGIVARRNTPDYETEVQALNGRVFELESTLNSTIATAEAEIENLRARNAALEAELGDLAHQSAEVQSMRERMQELEQRAERAEVAGTNLENMKAELHTFLAEISDRATGLLAVATDTPPTAAKLAHGPGATDDLPPAPDGDQNQKQEHRIAPAERSNEQH